MFYMARVNSRAATYRFLFASFALTALFIVTAFVVFATSGSVEKSSYLIKWDAVPGSIAANTVRTLVMRSYENAVDALSASDPLKREARLRDMFSQDEAIKQTLAVYQKTILINPVLDSANIERLEMLLANYGRERTHFVEQVRAGHLAEATAFLEGNLTPAYRTLLDTCDEVVRYNHDNADRLAGAISSAAIHLRRTMIVTVGLAVVCGVSLALMLRSRRKEELELGQQRHRVALALRAAGAVTYVRDFRTGTIEWSNDVDEIGGRLAGGLPRTIEELLSAIHHADQPRARGALVASRRHLAPCDIEYRMTMKDGQIVWLRDVGTCSAELGPKGIMFGVVSNITGQKRAQEETARLETQLRESQKIEALGTLAGGIAHDLNNSLTAIIGNADMQLADLREAGADAGRQQPLELILRAGHRASHLVRQILTFSRRTDKHLKPMTLAPLVLEVFQLIRSTAPASVEMAHDLAPELPQIEGDATQLYQVMINLCTNAVHAMKDTHGRLEVRLDTVMADMDLLKLHAGLRPGLQVRLSISDTGHGIDSVTLKRIFEPFFTTKAPGEGTGLGLAVVHGIVKEHGGGVFCYSRPREGTVFHLYFPAIAREGEAIPNYNGQGEVPQGQGERVLIVDDDMATRVTAAAMLTRLGYKVQDHESAEEALKVFRANAGLFDLVVTDLAMPNMTGLEFAAEIRRIRPATPIMLVTGFAGNLTGESLRKIGIGKLLLKPLTREKLGPAMQEVLADTRLPSPTDRYPT